MPKQRLVLSEPTTLGSACVGEKTLLPPQVLSWSALRSLAEEISNFERFGSVDCFTQIVFKAKGVWRSSEVRACVGLLGITGIALPWTKLHSLDLRRKANSADRVRNVDSSQSRVFWDSLVPGDDSHGLLCAKVSVILWCALSRLC
ncbi:hypothetical protein KIL84_001089 [Mauremys mutica]|uniref:Uncharacterized protein n=1 Tax=Mauremys mutica TaxID=74926 RepID=A0A9D3WXV9_9SAUR|nr:hypothetical protein KIL84_001089 [Mauremys mutica]